MDTYLGYVGHPDISTILPSLSQGAAETELRTFSWRRDWLGRMANVCSQILRLVILGPPRLYEFHIKSESGWPKIFPPRRNQEHFRTPILCRVSMTAVSWIIYRREGKGREWKGRSLPFPYLDHGFQQLESKITLAKNMVPPTRKPQYFSKIS